MFMFNLLLSLINSMAVLLVVAYLVTRTRWFEELAGGQVGLRGHLMLILVFGSLGIYGTASGIIVMNAVANTRGIGPLVAGLLGGPLAGLGAGLLAGLHRHFFGADFGSDASVIATILTGLAGGVYHFFTTRRTGQHISVWGAAIFAVATQIFQLAQLLAMSKPFAQAWGVVKLVGLPMVFANGLGTAIFFYFMTNLIKERSLRAQRDKYLAQKLKIQGELSVARDIQMSLVPKMFPKTPDWEACSLFAHLHSAREVGGDFYDFFLDGEGKLIFVIGDVSDKGVPAALFMAVTKTLFKGMSEPGQMPHELLTRVNREVEDGNDLSMFVTLFCAKLDFATGELWFSNAGHNPPLILRKDGEVTWLKLPPGLVLGALPFSTFTTEKIILAPGDAILTYTDGVTEAMNRQGGMYSEPRLLETLQAMAGATPQQLVEGLGASVTAFADGARQSDDVTILAVKYNGIAV